MGYSASASVVFGLKVPRSEMMVEHLERGCKHTLKEKQKFCSECGAPAYVKEEVYAFEEGNNDGLDFHAPTYETAVGVLGFSLVPLLGGDEDISVIATPSAKMAQSIQDFCKEHKIRVSEDKLKTYSFTYHSY